MQIENANWMNEELFYIQYIYISLYIISRITKTTTHEQCEVNSIHNIPLPKWLAFNGTKRQRAKVNDDQSEMYENDLLTLRFTFLAYDYICLIIKLNWS